MKNIVNELIKSMGLNNYNFKVKDSGWDDTISIVLIGEENEDIFHITIDFNIELEKVYIFEVYNNNVELIDKYDLNDFTSVTSFIESFFIYQIYILTTHIKTFYKASN